MKKPKKERDLCTHCGEPVLKVNPEIQNKTKIHVGPQATVWKCVMCELAVVRMDNPPKRLPNKPPY